MTAALLAVVAVLALGVEEARAGGHGIGGPVILGGDALPAHGSRDTTSDVNVGGWLYLERALENMAPYVTRSGVPLSIAALGSADSTATSGDAGAAIHYAAQDAIFGIPVAYYNGGPAIAAFFESLRAGGERPGIIWIAGNGSSNDLSDDPTEAAALVDNATTIADFVNGGGGLLSHGSEYGWLTVLLPGASSVRSGGARDLVLTPEGSWLNAFTEDDLNSGPWLSHFEGDLGPLDPLVVSREVDDSTGADARVFVGGREVLLSDSISLGPSGVVRPLGTTHTLHATVRDDQNQPKPGVSVTFTIISGPNRGETGTGATDDRGEATFSWDGDGGPGTDAVQASFSSATGRTHTATATIEWTDLPSIPLFPVGAIPAAVVGSLGVALLWRRHRPSLV